MSLKDDILDDIANQMSQHVDWNIMADMKILTGWTCIKLERYVSNEHAVDISVWIEENCQGRWDYLANKFLFERSEDAVAFSLRWA